MPTHDRAKGPASREPVPPVPGHLPVPPPAAEPDPRIDEAPSAGVEIGPGEGTHPHAPSRPPIERER